MSRYPNRGMIPDLYFFQTKSQARDRPCRMARMYDDDDDELVVTTKDGLVTVSQNGVCIALVVVILLMIGAGASDCYPSSETSHLSIVDIGMALGECKVELEMDKEFIDEMKREFEDFKRKMEDLSRKIEDLEREIEDGRTARLDLEDDIQMEELHINIAMSKNTRSLWRGPSSH